MQMLLTDAIPIYDGTTDAGTFFLTFFQSFFGTPAILVGLFSLLGAILLRKKFSETITTLFKTIAGFLILSAGSTIIAAPLNNFQLLFSDLFGVHGLIPNNDAFAASFFKIAPEAAQLGSVVMIVAMVLNMILSGTSRFRYVYLSGHVLFYMSIMLAAVMVLGGGNGTTLLNLADPGDYVIALLSASFLMAVYMVISAAACHRFVLQITKQANISMAHTGSLSYVISGWIGEAIHKIKKGKVLSTESIKFPKWLQFFRNTFISISITMLIIFMIIYLPEGIMYNTGVKNINDVVSVIPGQANTSVQNQLANLFGAKASTNWVIQMFLDAFTFAAGVEILLFGVRMIIGEIVPAFRGISQKFIKNSIAALDCPIVYPFAPNAVLIGFVTSLIAGFIGMAITIGINQANPAISIILPGVVPHFFLGATSGVYGNTKGGIWGCVIGSFINGIIISLIPLVFVVGHWTPQASLTWGDTDYILGVVPGVFALAGGVAARVLLVVIPVAIYLILMIDGIAVWTIKRKKQRNQNLETTPINK